MDRTGTDGAMARRDGAGAIRRDQLRWVSYLAALAFLTLFLLGGRGMRAEAATAAEKEVFTYLTDRMSLTPAAACGIMGNIRAESGFIPGITGMGGAYGLCQWGGGRITRLRNYCASHGLNASSINGQLQFLNYELQQFYPRVYNYLRGVENTAQGAYNAAYYWCVYYEIPANRYSQAAYRGGIARNIYWSAIGSRATYLMTATAKNGVKLTWNISGSPAVEIWRALGSDGDYTLIATTKKGAKSYVDRSALARKKYSYYICPAGSDGARSNKSAISPKRTLKDEEAVISLSREEYVYNGKARTPKVTITYGTDKLKKGRDFTVTYQNNRNAGKAVVEIRGKGSYLGTVKKTFVIRKAQWKLKVKDITLRRSKGQLKLNCPAGASMRLASSDKEVAKVQGTALVLKGKGVSQITVTIKKDKNHRALTKSFLLTVK